MTRSTVFFAALAAAAATAATLSFPAYAEEASKTSQVRYADLDLKSAAGAEALKARVARAARRICSVGDEQSLDAAAAANSCAKVAIAKAMPQVELALANAGTQVAESGRVSVAAH